MTQLHGCAPQQQKLAAALQLSLHDVGEGGAKASNRGSAVPAAPHRAAAALRAGGVSPLLCHSCSLAFALSLPLLLGIDRVQIRVITPPSVARPDSNGT